VDSAGDAQANPAGVAIAVPTPSAMAKAPNRPTYLLHPIALTAIAVTPYSVFERCQEGCVGAACAVPASRANMAPPQPLQFQLRDTSQTLMGAATTVADTSFPPSQSMRVMNVIILLCMPACKCTLGG
jgi:hypothetical protein